MKLIFAVVIGIILIAVLIACFSMGKSTPSNISKSKGDSTANVEPQSEKTGKYQKITSEEAKERIDKNPNAIVMDVRSQEEYDSGHIINAILIPLNTISDVKPEMLPDFNAEILVHCRTGIRSKQAAKKLIALGYTNVYDFGGIQDWAYEVVTNEN